VNKEKGGAANLGKWRRFGKKKKWKVIGRRIFRTCLEAPFLKKESIVSGRLIGMRKKTASTFLNDMEKVLHPGERAERNW